MLPLTLVLKSMSLLGVVWNRVLYKNQEEHSEINREFLREKPKKMKSTGETRRGGERSESWRQTMGAHPYSKIHRK